MTTIIDGEYKVTTLDNGTAIREINSAPPTPPKSWDAYAFYRLFTPAERIAIRTLGNTDSIAYDFLHTLEMTIASGGRVNANDADLAAGVAYLQAQPSSSPALTAARAAAILAS